MLVNENDVLAHFGIKGMRWGVRRTPEQLGHRKKGKSNNRSEDEKEVSSLRKKKTKNLSNKELEKITKRMNLERQYSELKRKEISAGEQYVNSVLKYATTAATIYGLSKSPMVKDLKKKIGKKYAVEIPKIDIKG